MYANKRTQSIIRMTELAILTALVLVLQLAGVAIRLPFLATPISLVLIPIALGAMLLGPLAGAWLGFVFGLVVYITCGVMALDPFTAYLFQAHPFVTAMICLVKSTAAGYLSGLVYRLVRGKSRYGATFAGAAVTPIVNTGIFILGCLTIWGTMSELAGESGVIYFLFIGCAGINFLFELAVNLFLAPALHRIMEAVSGKKHPAPEQIEQ
jgi:uncharacterized membrane protein